MNIFFDLVVAVYTILLCGEFKRIGGIGGKPGQRFLYSTLGVGVVSSLGAFLLGTHYLSCLLVLALHLTLFWLPKTLIGKKISSHPLNKPWLYVEGTIEGFKLFPIYPSLLGAITAVGLGSLFAKLEIANIQVKGLSDKIFGGAIGFLTVLLALR